MHSNKTSSTRLYSQCRIISDHLCIREARFPLEIGRFAYSRRCDERENEIYQTMQISFIRSNYIFHGPVVFMSVKLHLKIAFTLIVKKCWTKIVFIVLWIPDPSVLPASIYGSSIDLKKILLYNIFYERLSSNEMVSITF